MAKQVWKAGNMLYPLPVVMVTVRDRAGKANIITVAWAGTVCTNPPMLSISVRPERYSHRAECAGKDAASVAELDSGIRQNMKKYEDWLF